MRGGLGGATPLRWVWGGSGGGYSIEVGLCQGGEGGLGVAAPSRWAGRSLSRGGCFSGGPQRLVGGGALRG